MTKEQRTVVRYWRGLPVILVGDRIVWFVLGNTVKNSRKSTVAARKAEPKHRTWSITLSCLGDWQNRSKNDKIHYFQRMWLCPPRQCFCDVSVCTHIELFPRLNQKVQKVFNSANFWATQSVSRYVTNILFFVDKGIKSWNSWQSFCKPNLLKTNTADLSY
jgi:hypothetical protein